MSFRGDGKNSVVTARIEAGDLREFGEATSGAIADQHSDDIDCLGDQGARHSDDAFLDELLHAPQRAECRSGVDRADTAGVAGAPSLQQVERFGPSHFADRDTVRPQAQCGADQIGESCNAVLGAQRHQVGRGTLQLAGVLNEDHTVKPLDYDAIAFHTVAFLCEAYYGPFFGLHDMGRGGDWVESMVQIAVIGRRAVEALAEIIGLELDDIDLPAPETTPLEDLALGKLIAELGRLPATDALPDWQRNVLASIPHYLKNRGHYRQWCEAADIAETAALTGTNPANVMEADSDLIHFITAVGIEQDAALTRLFHRRFLRQCLIIAGADPAPDHIALAKMEPILDRKLD